eukprot:tig00021038_g17502.t1
MCMAFQLETEDGRAMADVFRMAGLDPSAAVGSAVALAAGGAVAVVGLRTSVAAQPMSYTFTGYEIPHISISATAALFSSKIDFPYFSRVVPSDAMQGPALADLVANMGWQRCAIVFTQDVYGQGIVAGFVERAQALKLTVAARQAFDPKGSAAATALTIDALRESSVYVTVIAMLHADAAVFLGAASDGGLVGRDFAYLCSDSLAVDSALLGKSAKAMAALDGMVGIRPVNGSDTAAYAALLARWTEAEGGRAAAAAGAGEQRAMPYYGLFTQDGVTAFVRALELLGADRILSHANASRAAAATGPGGFAKNGIGAALRDALTRVSFDGATGRVAFTAAGDLGAYTAGQGFRPARLASSVLWYAGRVDPPSDRIVCGAGKRLEADETLVGGTCVDCPPGFFAAAGSTACTGCPPGTFSGAPGSAACSPCKPGYFNDLHNQTSCSPCPIGASCDGPSLPAPLPGYYPVPWEPNRRFHPCPEPNACPGVDRTLAAPFMPGNSSSTAAFESGLSIATTAPSRFCAEGHTGLLCTECVAGYGRVGSFGCRPCMAPAPSYALLVLGIVFLLAAAGYIIRATVRSALRSEKKGPILLKILLSYLQVVSLCRFSVPNSAHVTSTFFAITTTVLSPIDSFVNVDCISPGSGPDGAHLGGFYVTLKVYVAAPALALVAALAALAFGYLSPLLRRRLRLRSRSTSGASISGSPKESGYRVQSVPFASVPRVPLHRLSMEERQRRASTASSHGHGPLGAAGEAAHGSGRRTASMDSMADSIAQRSASVGACLELEAFSRDEAAAGDLEKSSEGFGGISEAPAARARAPLARVRRGASVGYEPAPATSRSVVEARTDRGGSLAEQAQRAEERYQRALLAAKMKAFSAALSSGNGGSVRGRARSGSVGSIQAPTQRKLSNAMRHAAELAAKFYTPTPVDYFVCTLLVSMFLVLPAIAEKVILAFRCVDIGGRPFLWTDITIACDSAEYQLNTNTIALTAIFTHVILLSIVPFACLFAVRHYMFAPHMRTRFAFLVRGYRMRYSYFEAFIVARKFLVVFISVFFSEGAPVQSVIALAVLIYTTIFTARVRPFEFRECNLLETLSSAATTITVVCGTYYSTVAMDGGQAFRVGVFILFVNISFLCIWLLFFARDLLERARQFWLRAFHLARASDRGEVAIATTVERKDADLETNFSRSFAPTMFGDDPSLADGDQAAADPEEEEEEAVNPETHPEEAEDTVAGRSQRRMRRLEPPVQGSRPATSRGAVPRASLRAAGGAGPAGGAGAGGFGNSLRWSRLQRQSSWKSSSTAHARTAREALADIERHDPADFHAHASPEKLAAFSNARARRQSQSRISAAPIATHRAIPEHSELDAEIVVAAAAADDDDGTSVKLAAKAAAAAEAEEAEEAGGEVVREFKAPGLGDSPQPPSPARAALEEARAGVSRSIDQKLQLQASARSRGGARSAGSRGAVAFTADRERGDLAMATALPGRAVARARSAGPRPRPPARQPAADVGAEADRSGSPPSHPGPAPDAMEDAVDVDVDVDVGASSRSGSRAKSRAKSGAPDLDLLPDYSPMATPPSAASRSMSPSCKRRPPELAIHLPGGRDALVYTIEFPIAVPPVRVEFSPSPLGLSPSPPGSAGADSDRDWAGPLVWTPAAVLEAPDETGGAVAPATYAFPEPFSFSQ